MYILENEILKIVVKDKGAELKSIFHKPLQLDYMWSGDPTYWGKTSPVLFPIVGTLKNDVYDYKGKKYQLKRHGFARDKKFHMTSQDATGLHFTLHSDEETLSAFPFPFLFSICYQLEKNVLAVNYVVENLGDDVMPFSVGGHPAFKLPMVKGTNYNDYFLHFEKAETSGRWPISAEGLIKEQPEMLLESTDTLPLYKGLFAKDAIVLKQLASDWVSLRSFKTDRGLKFHFAGFPYLGLWAAPGADFICVEPWCGIADSVNADGNIMHKEGIILLPSKKSFSITWKVELL